MKTATSKEIKSELDNIPQHELKELCLRLARFKKENKELLTYLLFEAGDEQSYIASIKESLHLMFTEVNVKTPYITKKNLRKIIRTSARYCRYSGKATTEAEVLLFICQEIQHLGLHLQKSPALLKLYTGLLNKISKTIQTLHEDLQYDYLSELKKLQ